MRYRTWRGTSRAGRCGLREASLAAPSGIVARVSDSGCQAATGSGVARSAAAVLGIAGLLAGIPAVALEPTGARLDYQVEEGLNTNRFVREDDVAAHVVLRAGTDA